MNSKYCTPGCTGDINPCILAVGMDTVPQRVLEILTLVFSRSGWILYPRVYWRNTPSSGFAPPVAKYIGKDLTGRKLRLKLNLMLTLLHNLFLVLNLSLHKSNGSKSPDSRS